jgi:hypothetical protein
MAYRAERRLYMGTDENGDPVYRERGEMVPEAETWDWRSLRAWVNEGYVKEVIYAEPTPKPEPSRARKAKETVDATSG